MSDVRHRLRFLERRPKQWDAFFEAARDDPPLPEGVALVESLLADHDVTWLTGRPERTRRLTEEWLGAQGLPVAPLLMRRDDDRRPARFAKREVLRRLAARHPIALVLDDDPAVVEDLRAEGLPVRLATWLPHSSTLEGAQERQGRT